ncbi:DUF1465 family protein [Candidatus Kaiserbacteria bacterium]|nr:DUF1465 family protein [Candidatus Kaiserbacteria bacterium]
MRVQESTAVYLADYVKVYSKSDAFALLFKEGMSLVEEVAAYLDGQGKRASKTLERSVAAAYAAESMRMTTRLMNVAAWLLLVRSKRDDDFTEVQFQTSRRSLRLHESSRDKPDRAGLPKIMCELLEKSDSIVARVRHIDRIMSTSGVLSAYAPEPGLSDARGLQARIAEAFCRG